MVDSTQDLFKKALAFIKNAPAGNPEINNQQKLTFYALFKQATDGATPKNAKQPSRLKMVDRYKFDTWKALGNISKEDAMNRYISELTKLAPNWNLPKPKL